MRLIFEKSMPGRRAVQTGPGDVPTMNIRNSLLREQAAELPELSELDDSNFYPLGSCTMKYNPKVAEHIASYPGFAQLHPLLPQLRMGGMLTQGALRVLYEIDLLLREITGMAGFTMQPLAGAHGELTGMMIMAAYHKDKGNKKTTILIPEGRHYGYCSCQTTSE
jgi:glycine dehydrogenase subunit 2